MTKNILTINNKKLFDFYNEHKHLNFEAVNLIFHDILVKLVDNMAATMSSSVNGEILSIVNKQENELSQIKEHFSSMSDSVTQIQNETKNISAQCSHIDNLTNNLQTINSNITQMKTDMSNTISVKFMDFKNDYISDIKTILNDNQDSDKNEIVNLIEKNNSIFIDKTKLLLSETISKDVQEHNAYITSAIENNNISLVDKTKLMLIDNQEKYKINMNSTMTTFEKTMSDEMKVMIARCDDNSIKDFITSFDSKCSVLFQTMQQPVFNSLTASEERIQTNLQTIKESAIISQNKHDNTMCELSSYLKKFQNSSFKGNMGESELEVVLTQMYPSGEVINSSSNKACGDFLLKRDHKPNIMFENKVYERNVNSDEVHKFIRDASEINTHAIFLSQNSGISRKQSFQIDLHKGLILVYVHNVDYSRDKIQIAVDIIENLSERITEFDSEEEHENVISKTILDEINQEYNYFSKQRDDIILMSKDYQKKLISQLEGLQMGTLNKYLSSKYANSTKVIHNCTHCNEFAAPTKKSLSAHVRACKKRIMNESQDNIIIED